MDLLWEEKNTSAAALLNGKGHFTVEFYIFWNNVKHSLQITVKNCDLLMTCDSEVMLTFLIFVIFFTCKEKQLLDTYNGN